MCCGFLNYVFVSDGICCFCGDIGVFCYVCVVGDEWGVDAGDIEFERVGEVVVSRDRRGNFVCVFD